MVLEFDISPDSPPTCHRMVTVTFLLQHDHPPSPGQSSTNQGRLPTISRTVTNHPQDGHPQFPGRSTTIPRKIIYHHEEGSFIIHGHPPASGRSPTIRRTVIHHSPRGHPLFSAQTPTIPRRITHHSQDGPSPFTGRTPTIPRKLTLYPQDGHLPFHYPNDSHQPSPGGPPNIHRTVVHQPQQEDQPLY